MPIPKFTKPVLGTPDLGSFAGKQDFDYSLGVNTNQYEYGGQFDDIIRNTQRGEQDFGFREEDLGRNNDRRLEDIGTSRENLARDRRYNDEDYGRSTGRVNDDTSRTLGDLAFNQVYNKRDQIEANNSQGLLSSGRGAERLMRQQRAYDGQVGDVNRQSARTLEDLATGNTRAIEGFDSRGKGIDTYARRGDEDYATNSYRLGIEKDRFGEDQQTAFDRTGAGYAIANQSTLGGLAARITAQSAPVQQQAAPAPAKAVFTPSPLGPNVPIKAGGYTPTKPKKPYVPPIPKVR